MVGRQTHHRGGPRAYIIMGHQKSVATVTDELTYASKVGAYDRRSNGKCLPARRWAPSPAIARERQARQRQPENCSPALGHRRNNLNAMIWGCRTSYFVNGIFLGRPPRRPHKRPSSTRRSAGRRLKASTRMCTPLTGSTGPEIQTGTIRHLYCSALNAVLYLVSDALTIEDKLFAETPLLSSAP